MTEVHDSLAGDQENKQIGIVTKESAKTPVQKIVGKWESASNSKYKFFFEFLKSGWYRKWDMDKFKPSAFTGHWLLKKKNTYMLHDCHKGDLSLKVYKIDSLTMKVKCGYFNKNDIVRFYKIDNKSFYSKPLDFRLIGNKIVLNENSGNEVIFAGMTSEDFQTALCNFNISRTVKSTDDNNYEVFYIKGPKGDTLFHALSINGNVDPIIIDSGTIKTEKGIHVGSTLDDVKAAYRDITLQRSEIKGEVIGRAGDLHFSLGHISGLINLIPGKMRVKQIII